MNSLHYVIVEAAQCYNNTEEIAGTTIVVNNTIEDVSSINRVVRVVSAPEGTILKKDDEIIIHHNILRTVNGWHAKVESEYWIKDNHYYVPVDEIFAYKRDGVWNAISPFCFLKPIEAVESTFLIESKQESTHKGKVRLRGCIGLINSELEVQGVKVGDECIIKPYSEYEFMIDGELYYKMKTKDIIGTIT